MKTIKHKINIPIYHGFLVIIITTNLKKIAKKYNQESISNATDYDFDAIVFDKPNKKGITVYYYVQKANVSYGAIAHDAKHLVNKIFKDRGICLDLNNDESECYLLGWIVNQIHLHINKKK